MENVRAQKNSHISMSSTYVAKALASKDEFAGRRWYYGFRELNNQFDEDNCKKVAKNLLVRYSKLTKNWDVDKNPEWIL